VGVKPVNQIHQHHQRQNSSAPVNPVVFYQAAKNLKSVQVYQYINPN